MRIRLGRAGVVAIVTLLLALASGCYVPARYDIAFPEGVGQEIPQFFLADAQQILVIPCWHWTKTSEYGFGPSALITVDDLDRLPAIVPRWRGFEVIDLFGHEGSEAPHSCGVLIITDTGKALRSQFRYLFPPQGEGRGRWVWQRAEVALIGERIKAALLDLVSGQSPGSTTTGMLFEKPYGEFYDRAENAGPVNAFLDLLPTSGSDAWQAVNDPIADD